MSMDAVADAVPSELSELSELGEPDRLDGLDEGTVWVAEPVVLTDSGVWSVVRAVLGKAGTGTGSSSSMSEPKDDLLDGQGDDLWESESDGDAGAHETDGSPDSGLDSGSRAARRARQSTLPPAKLEAIRLLSQFLRTKRHAAKLQQSDVRKLVQTHPTLPEKMSQSYVPHIENLAGDTQHSSDVGLFKVWAILRAVGSSLAELEDYLTHAHARVSTVAQRREQALLAQFRLLSPARQQHALDLINLVVADELRADETKLAELDSAADLVAADENEHPANHNSRHTS